MSAVRTPTTGGLRPLLWTVNEFHTVGSTKIWRGRRPKLIRGVIVVQGQMTPRHANGIALADEVLRAAFGVGWYVRIQFPLVVGTDSDPHPDLAVVPGRPRDYSTHPTTAALVIEVSDTTLAEDATIMAELYAEAGVPDYWVVDVVGRRVLVMRDPAPVAAGGYAFRTQLTFGPTDTISPLAVPAATVAVSDLLP